MDRYALFLTAAYFVGAVVFYLLAKRDGRNSKDIIDLLWVMILSALLGSKLFHVFFEAKGHWLPSGVQATGVWDLLKEDPWHWARFFDPGYVFYGGLIVSFGVTWLFIKHARIERIWALADNVAPALAFGLGVGRIGCYVGGCCYGFVGAYPVQWVESAFGFVAFGLMLLFYKKKRFDGEIFCLFLMSYALFRGVIEFFRADEDRGLWLLGLSTSQLISMLVFVIVTLRLWKASKELR